MLFYQTLNFNQNGCIIRQLGRKQLSLIQTFLDLLSIPLKKILHNSVVVFFRNKNYTAFYSLRDCKSDDTNTHIIINVQSTQKAKQMGYFLNITCAISTSWLVSSPKFMTTVNATLCIYACDTRHRSNTVIGSHSHMVT